MKSDGFLGQVVSAVSRRTPAFDHDCRPEVAAELRRQAQELRRESLTCSQLDARGMLRAAERLIRRADELDPQGGKS